MDVGDGGARAPVAAAAAAGAQQRGGPPGGPLPPAAPGGAPQQEAQHRPDFELPRPADGRMQQLPVMRPGMAPPVPLPPAGREAAAPRALPAPANAGAMQPQNDGGAGAPAGANAPEQGGDGVQQQRALALNAQRQAAADLAVANANAAVHAAHVQAAAAHHAQQHLPPGAQPARREATNDYAALFVALIGEGDNPQGVVNTTDGRVVRAFHRFTLVDQSGRAMAILYALMPSALLAAAAFKALFAAQCGWTLHM